MVKQFYASLRTLISKHLKGSQRVITLGDKDWLSVWRDAPNSYTIIFESSFGEEKSWSHRDVPLRLVVLAIKSFDGMTDMFGQSFYNKKTHDFCY